MMSRSKTMLFLKIKKLCIMKVLNLICLFFINNQTRDIMAR